MTNRRELARQVFLFASTCAYLASLFLTWWQITLAETFAGNTHHVFRSDGLGGFLSQTNRLGELCVAGAVAVLIVAATALRSKDRRLRLARRQLAIALVVFTALAVYELWRSNRDASVGVPSSEYIGSHIAYGAYVAIGMSLLVLISVLVLEAGGVRELFRRRRKDSSQSVGNV